MDDVLDEKDVEWIQKIIDGKANEIMFNAGLSKKYSVDVRMADANQDGVVDYKDIEKVRELIAMKIDSPKQLVYYVDVDGAINTAHVPSRPPSPRTSRTASSSRPSMPSIPSSDAISSL